MTEYAIPIQYIVKAAGPKEAEELLEGFLRFTFLSYGARFNIDDWEVVGATCVSSGEV